MHTSLYFTAAVCDQSAVFAAVSMRERGE